MFSKYLARFRFGWILLVCALGVAGSLLVACGRASQGVVSPAPPLSEIDGAAKIYVSQEGIYQIQQVDLEQIGFDLRAVDPLRFQLTLRGVEQPLWVSQADHEFVLLFYAAGSSSFYSQENVYWLKLLPEQADLTYAWEAAAALDSVAAASENAYQATKRWEENNLYHPQVTEGEHWFWASISSGQEQEFAGELANVASGPGYLKVELWAGTEDAITPDHHVRVAINDQVVIDETWDGIGWHTLEMELPAGIVKEGGNQVRVELPGDTGASAETSLVNWVALGYQRYPVARDDTLVFDGAQKPLLIAGVKGSLAVFDITLTEDAQLVGFLQSEGQVGFQGQVGQRYLVVGPDGYREPVRILPAQLFPDLRAAGLGAEYLVIGPPDLLEPLASLLDWRASQGLASKAVPLDAIYDQFNNGFPEPEAIRAFLQYAAQHWNPAPKYVLLVGDATFDPRGYQAAPEANVLPTYFVYTSFGGQTASDVMYALLDGDELPDLAIGRVPAQTQEQVEIFVNKTLSYEQNMPGEASGRVLAIADGQDEIFRSDAQAFLDIFAGYDTALYAPDPGIQEAGETIATYFEQGYGLIAYFGHGSVNMWGKDRLFTVEDVAGLTNEQLPVLLNLTCLNGLFTHPRLVSMAETMLWQPEGGAVAVLAPTSLTLSYDQSFLSQPLARGLSDPSVTRLGEALLQAQRQVPINGQGTQDVMRTFLLLGDPALLLVRIRSPKPTQIYP